MVDHNLLLPDAFYHPVCIHAACRDSGLLVLAQAQNLADDESKTSSSFEFTNLAKDRLDSRGCNLVKFSQSKFKR